MYEFFIAIRHLTARGRRPLARATAVTAVAGIACGVAVYLVANALANGFQSELQDKILRGTAHITLARRDGAAMSDWRLVAARVRATAGITDATGTTYDGVLLNGKTAPVYAVVRGTETNNENARRELETAVIAGSARELFNANHNTDENFPITADRIFPAVIGSELAARAGLKLDDTAEIIASANDLTGEGKTGATNTRRIRIVGIARFGLYEYDANWLMVNLFAAARITGAFQQSATFIGARVGDVYQAAAIAEKLRADLGADYTVVDWQTVNRPLFAALAFERKAGALVIALIVLLATLNITATLALMVVERRAEIAVLSALGARPRSLLLIFMLEGLTLGTLGMLAGVALGLIACAVANRFGLISLPAGIYEIGYVPLVPRATDIVLAAGVTLLLSLLATLYPARVAARMRPAAALKD